MATGLVASMLAFAVGAILDFALTTSENQHGFNIHTVGVILMIVGAVGAVVTVVAFVASGPARRHRTVVQDSRGNVAQREDTYL